MCTVQNERPTDLARWTAVGRTDPVALPLSGAIAPFSYRNPCRPQGLRVFEVGRPRAQGRTTEAGSDGLQRCAYEADLHTPRHRTR